jgi:hypothetical protein
VWCRSHIHAMNTCLFIERDYTAAKLLAGTPEVLGSKGNRF